MNLKDKVVVVTGASSGIGHQIALDFAKHGAKVVAVARRKERLEALAEQAESLEGEILPFAADLMNKEANEAMIDKALEVYGTIDVLVNSAGIMDEFKPIDEVTDDFWDWIMDLNLKAPMYSMRKAIQVFLEKKIAGSIINIASIGGTNGARAGAAYTASKHAMVGLSKNTAYMYVPEGIRCNVICPGGVETEVMDSQTELSERGIGRVMAGLDQSVRQGKPEEISSAVLYLASDEAKFVNGAVFVIDGGVSCN